MTNFSKILILIFFTGLIPQSSFAMNFLYNDDSDEEEAVLGEYGANFEDTEKFLEIHARSINRKKNIVSKRIRTLKADLKDSLRILSKIKLLFSEGFGRQVSSDEDLVNLVSRLIEDMKKKDRQIRRLQREISRIGTPEKKKRSPGKKRSIKKKFGSPEKWRSPGKRGTPGKRRKRRFESHDDVNTSLERVRKEVEEFRNSEECCCHKVRFLTKLVDEKLKEIEDLLGERNQAFLLGELNHSRAELEKLRKRRMKKQREYHQGISDCERKLIERGKKYERRLREKNREIEQLSIKIQKQNLVIEGMVRGFTVERIEDIHSAEEDGEFLGLSLNRYVQKKRQRKKRWEK
jgi:hypothetical protein